MSTVHERLAMADAARAQARLERQGESPQVSLRKGLKTKAHSATARNEPLNPKVAGSSPARPTK